MLEVQKNLDRFKNEPRIIKQITKFRFTRWYWKAWKANTAQVLAFQDPYPAYDRPKNLTQILKKRSIQNLLILKNRRLRLYLGYKKEYQYRKLMMLTRRSFFETHTEVMTQVLECRLFHLILRAGFVKNAEIAQTLIKLGHVRVNDIIVKDPHYIVPVTAVTRLLLPDYLRYSELGRSVIFTYQRIAHPTYFIINWKLMTIRFAQIPNSRQFSHPQFNLKSNDVSFFYGAI